MKTDKEKLKELGEKKDEAWKKFDEAWKKKDEALDKKDEAWKEYWDFKDKIEREKKMNETKTTYEKGCEKDLKENKKIIKKVFEIYSNPDYRIQFNKAESMMSDLLNKALEMKDENYAQ